MPKISIDEIKAKLGEQVSPEEANKMLEQALKFTGLPYKEKYEPDEVLKLGQVMLEKKLFELQQQDFSVLEPVFEAADKIAAEHQDENA